MSNDPGSQRRHRLWAMVAAAALLAAHAGLAVDALRQNSVVNDEVSHLASGLAHWQRGYFFLYHQNPPLARMLCTLPVLAAKPAVDYRHAQPGPDLRSEWAVGRDFMFANAARYHRLVCMARLVTVCLSLLGGWLLFRWAAQLFGHLGGLLALATWCVNPTVLALAGLAVPDMAAAVAGLWASYLYWRHLRDPGLLRAAAAGAALGAALLCKFTMLLLLPAWIAVWLVASTIGQQRPSGAGPDPRRPARSLSWAQALTLGTVALLVVNAGYGFQATCRPLGSYTFVSRPLAGPAWDRPGPGPGGNRWRGSPLGRLPVPLPAEFLLGLDAQQRDFERGFYSYLNGRLRQRGWWYYYLYGLLVKTPVGTVVLVALGLLYLCRPSCRADRSTELLLGLFPAVVLLAVSVKTGFNHHVRYVFPMYPFVCVWSGRLCRRPDGRPLALAAACCLVATAASTLSLHPQELAYFNELAGGPANGHRHLLESNIDWGQDLVRLRRWLAAHPHARPLFMAFHSQAAPEVYGIDYRPAPFGPCPDTRHLPADRLGPQPGWFAISTNLVMGLAHPIPDGRGGQIPVPFGAFAYFQQFTPVARPGYGLFIFHITEEAARQARQRLGLTTTPTPADSHNQQQRPPRPQRPK